MIKHDYSFGVSRYKFRTHLQKRSNSEIFYVQTRAAAETATDRKSRESFLLATNVCYESLHEPINVVRISLFTVLRIYTHILQTKRVNEIKR